MEDHTSAPAAMALTAAFNEETANQARKAVEEAKKTKPQPRIAQMQAKL